MEVDFFSKNRDAASIPKEDIVAALQRNFAGQFFTVGQHFVSEVNAFNLEFTVLSVQIIDLASLVEKSEKSSPPIASNNNSQTGGILHSNTQINLGKSQMSKLILTGGEE